MKSNHCIYFVFYTKKQQLIFIFFSYRVSINFNVNHTVDADYSEETDPTKAPSPQGQEKDAAEMRSRPNFEIEITKGNKILSFSCSYLQDSGTSGDLQQDEYRTYLYIV